MNNLFFFLLIISFLGVPICLILSIVFFIMKKRVKPTLLLSGISFVVFIISIIGFGVTIPKKSENSAVLASAEEVDALQKTAPPTSKNVSPEITSSEEHTTPIETTEVVETTVALTEKELFVQSMISNPDVTLDAANNTYDILRDDLGFETISVKKNMSGTIFEVKADDFNLKVTVSDKLYMVICGDYNMYQDDTVKYTKQNLEDRIIGNNDTTYYVIAQEIITNNLKSPSSANFCSISNCQMMRNGEYVAVKGYVDAANSFGSQIRNEFVAEFKVIDLSTFSYETIYININGDTVGEYIDLK